MVFSHSHCSIQHFVSAAVSALSADFDGVSFGSLDANKASTCLKANALVSRSPTINFMWDGRLLGQLVGSDVPRLVSCLQALSQSPSAAAAGPALQQQLGGPVETEEQLQQRLASLVKRHPVMLFMKGKRDQPFCRFSKAVLALMEEQGVKNFDTFDVFEDEAVREGLKRFSDWPTYPQLYVNVVFCGGASQPRLAVVFVLSHMCLLLSLSMAPVSSPSYILLGELLGGLDVLKSMVAEGTFKEAFPASAFE
ncbi:hypothetical protein ACSSS7_005413 [Eimeria intestinalis]